MAKRGRPRKNPQPIEEQEVEVMEVEDANVVEETTDNEPFEAEVQEMSTILEEYHHLIEHDNFDCQAHVSGENFLFKCWFRRYGFPMISLFFFAIYGYLRVLSTIK